MKMKADIDLMLFKLMALPSPFICACGAELRAKEIIKQHQNYMLIEVMERKRNLGTWLGPFRIIYDCQNRKVLRPGTFSKNDERHWLEIIDRQNI